MTLKGKASRRKGHDWERLLVRYLNQAGLVADRAGDAGQKHGDIILHSRGPVSWAVECKNRRDQSTAIASGVDRNRSRSGVGVVLLKRARKTDPGEGYAVMRIADWVTVLKHLEKRDF